MSSTGMFEGIQQGLLGVPEAECLLLDLQVNRGIEAELRLDPARLQGRQHVLEGPALRGALEARRIDLDEETAQRANAAASLLRAAEQLSRSLRVRPFEAASGNLERECDVAHDPSPGSVSSAARRRAVVDGRSPEESTTRNLAGSAAASAR